MGRVAAVVAVGALCAAPGAAPALAASPISLTVWSGERGPGGAAHGVTLNANGSGHLLDSPASLSRSSRFKAVGSFKPSNADARAIRAAARAALTGPLVTGGGLGGRYVALTVRVGGKQSFRLAWGRAPAKLIALLDKLDAALPPTRQLGAAEILALKPKQTEPRAADSLAACPPGKHPLEMHKTLGLKKAAQMGIATYSLKSSGGTGGDNIKVEAEWADAPVKADGTLNIQIVTSAPDPAAAAADFELRAEAAVRNAMQGLARPLDLDLQVAVRRPSDPPLPCYHQIELFKPGPSGGIRSGFDASSVGPDDVVYGFFTDAPGKDPVWAHEIGHLLGFDEAYSDFVTVKGVDIPAPPGSPWENFLINQLGGKPKSVVWPGHEKDIMGESGSPASRFLQPDLDKLFERAPLRIEWAAGDMLLNKSAGSQNFAAAPSPNSRLEVPPNGKAVANGLVAYCIDALKIPAGSGLDVFGPVTDLNHPAMDALMKVLRVIGNRPQDVNGVVFGAQHAVWRVTDNRSLNATAEDNAARAILAEAGVSDTATYDAPHVINADDNRLAPETRAVSLDGALPKLDPAPDSRRPPTITRVRALRRAGLLVVGITAAGDSAQATLTLQRRVGKHYKTVRTLGKRAVHGRTVLLFRGGRLARGVHRVRVTGVGAARTARLR